MGLFNSLFKPSPPEPKFKVGDICFYAPANVNGVNGGKKLFWVCSASYHISSKKNDPSGWLYTGYHVEPNVNPLDKTLISLRYRNDSLITLQESVLSPLELLVARG